MFQRVSGKSGFNLYLNPATKFKTTSIRIFLKGSLETEVEEEAILPFLLKRGSLKFPSLKDLSRHLESLYGTSLCLDISKVGEMQVLVISMDLVNPRFLKEDKDLLYRGVDVLNDILLNPVLEDGAFPEAHFKQERINLERYIGSVIDDKISYAHLRLVQEMFKGEPYGNYEWGDLEKISDLCSQGVYQSYRELTRTAPIDVYIVGNLSEEEKEKLPDLLLPFKGRSPQPVSGPVKSRPSAQEVIVEEQPLEQSKLVMGFRVDVQCRDEDYYALMLYSAILGGGSYSKLFKTVREKSGMAYYAHSSFEKLKGFLYVAAGIDTGNFETVTALVRDCMDEIASGKISDEEILNARRAIITGLKSIADSPGQTMEFDFLARAAGRELDIGRIIQIFDGLTREQVSGVTRLIHSGKTFFLKGTGNSHGADDH